MSKDKLRKKGEKKGAVDISQPKKVFNFKDMFKNVMKPKLSYSNVLKTKKTAKYPTLKIKAFPKNFNKNINDEYNKLNIAQQQLVNLTAYQLADLVNKTETPGYFGTLDKINFLNKPYTYYDDKGERTENLGNYTRSDNNNGTYNLNGEDRIDLVGKTINGVNPLVTFIHEGHHALDDLWMKTYQKAAINYLAKKEQKDENQRTTFDSKQIYNQARDIINNQSLLNYDFDSTKDFANLGKNPDGSSTKKLISNFREAKTELDNIFSSNQDPGGTFLNFSEFAAHLLENISMPLNIGTDSSNKRGRKFLYNILTEIHKNHKPAIDLKEYNDLDQAFQARIKELYNSKKSLDSIPNNNDDTKTINVLPLTPSNTTTVTEQNKKSDNDTRDKNSLSLMPNTDPYTQQLNSDTESYTNLVPNSKRSRNKFKEGGYVRGNNNSYDPYFNTYNYAPATTPFEYLTNQMVDAGYDVEGYDDPYMSYGNAYDNNGSQYSFKEGGSVKEGDLPRLADLIARYGRNGDTELAHINPIEAHILKSLGGSGTINPDTGLPEYFFRGVRNFIKNPGKTISKTFKNPKRTIADTIGTAAAIFGGPLGGALGGAARSVIRGDGENPLYGALKGAGYGTALPMVGNLAGQGLSALGANGLGSSLQNYATSNMGSWFGNVAQAGGGIRGLGLPFTGRSSAGNVASYSPYSVFSQGMGMGRGQGLGVSSGDYAENYYNYMLDRQKKQDNMGFTDKLQDYLTQPGNLLTLGTTAAQYLGREKPKSPEKIAEEERRYRNASRKTIAEIEADEALETARQDLQKKRKNKQLEEDIKNMGSVRRRVVSPEEFARTGRWLEYTDDEGNPVRMKGGGSAHSPYTYLTEETYSPGSPIGYLSGNSGGQDDLIDARLSDGEYVFDASTVSDLGDGNNAAGARKLDMFRENLRKHKRGGKVTLPPKAKSLENYLRG